MDERMIRERNRIFSELALLMYGFALCAFLVKILLLGKALDDCVVEYVIMIAAPVYQYVRARQRKLSLYQPELISRSLRRKKNVLSVAVAAGMFALCLWRFSADIREGLCSLAAFILVFVAVKLLVVKIEKERSRKLDREYEDE